MCEIIFSIEKVNDKTNKSHNIYFEINKTLKMTMFTVGDKFNELVEVTLLHKQALKKQRGNNVDIIDESAKSQDFFQDNKPSERKYTTTRIKSRNFLSNIAYVGINKEDFYNENFIFDVYLLVTKN